MADHKAELPVGFARAVASGVNGPTTWENVFYFGVTKIPPDEDTVYTEIAECCTRFYTDVFSVGAFPTSWHLFETHVILKNEDGTVSRRTVADAVAGTGSESPEAAQSAYLVNFDTGDPRRGGKPRKYVGGVHQSKLLTSATLLPAFLAAANSAMGTWFEFIGATENQLVLTELSFRNNNTWRDVPLAYAITSGSVSPILATQRRRVDRLR